MLQEFSTKNKLSESNFLEVYVVVHYIHQTVVQLVYQTIDYRRLH